MILAAAVNPALPLRRVALLATAFALLDSLRIVAYPRTLVALHGSGSADQPSLFTRSTLLSANLTMALWLYEQNGCRTNRAISVNACNALMCGAIAASVGWLRWMQSAFASASSL
ncbi:MAG: hypothetical protein IPM30_15990 [Burkholderiales bacterium]|nr:hypothetical protein [Burkholderiales bacterium]